tara:strand:+ start:3090 stop:5036 length:1947 start_codon:yes stop_codon:yes gene_type:complete
VSDYIKDMFIEVRDRDETISPLTELEQMMKEVSKVLYGATMPNDDGVLEEGADLKIPVERYDAFKRKIEQWGMLFNKFTDHAQDLGHPEHAKAAAPKLLRKVNKLESELRKIMNEFDLNYKSYADERHAALKKLDQFDGDNEYFLEEEVIEEGERFSMSIPIPKLNPNEAWGDPNSQSRKDIDRIFASITRKGGIKERIQHVNSFVDPKQAERKGRGKRFNAILNMMMIIEALQACLNDYSESSAGFVFEGFMAALTGGSQQADRVGGTLPIEDFVTGDNENVSLKLLSPNTGIHGSFTNLVDYLFLRGGAGEPEIKYLIGRKNSEDGEAVSQLSISDFVISRKNFMAIMESSKKNRALLGDEETKNRLKLQIQNFSDSPKWKAGMQQVLAKVPGYTGGMFSKNVDDEGLFEPDQESDLVFKKQKEYHGVKLKDYKNDAENSAEASVKAGQEPNFEKWAKSQADNLKDLMPPVRDPENPEEVAAAQKKQQRNLANLQKFYNAAYTAAAEEAAQVAESHFGAFHVREKRMMQEQRVLMEGGGRDGGSQWEISVAMMSKLRKVAEVQYYGELNMSDENIKACAAIYIEKMKGDMMELLETTKSFTENVGMYFSADRRSTAMNANERAQDEGVKVVNLLAQSAEPAPDEIE